MQKNKLIPLALIILGLSVIVLAFGSYVFLSKNTNETVNASNYIYVEGPFPDIPRVSIEDAKQAYDEKSAVIVDVRGDDAFSAGHIPGALSIPENDIAARIVKLDPDSWFITYCT